jgi:hypothetical protein
LRTSANMRTQWTTKLTAQQKNNTDNMANMIGNFSHPNARRIERNKISIGIVIRTNVIITSLGDGSLLCRDVFADAACRAVESRETNIDPTLPGSPVVLCYSKTYGEHFTTHH